MFRTISMSADHQCQILCDFALTVQYDIKNKIWIIWCYQIKCVRCHLIGQYFFDVMLNSDKNVSYNISGSHKELIKNAKIFVLEFCTMFSCNKLWKNICFKMYCIFHGFASGDFLKTINSKNWAVKCQILFSFTS